MKGHPKDFLYHPLRNRKYVLLIVVPKIERGHAIEEKLNAISKYDFGSEVRVMVVQNALLNLLIRKGLINHREFK